MTKHFFSNVRRVRVLAGTAGALLLLSGCANKQLNYSNGLLGSREVIPPPYATVNDAPLQSTSTSTMAASPAVEEPFNAADASFTIVTPADNEPIPPIAVPEKQKITKTAPVKVTVKQSVKPNYTPQKQTTYTIKKGDTLGDIAIEYNVSWPRIAKANPTIDPNKLKIGQTIVIPAPSAKIKSSPSKKSNVKKTTSSSSKKSTTAVNGIHTVVSGENIWIIAKHYKVKRDEIRSWNNLTSDLLMVGQKLRIKSDAPAVNGKSSSKTSSTATIIVPKKENVTITNEPVDLLQTPQETPQPANDDELKILEEGIQTPPETPVAPQKATTTNVPHSVRENETIGDIATMYGIPAEAILKQNPQIKSDSDLKTGMTLTIPYTK